MGRCVHTWPTWRSLSFMSVTCWSIILFLCPVTLTLHRAWQESAPGTNISNIIQKPQLLGLELQFGDMILWLTPHQAQRDLWMGYEDRNEKTKKNFFLLVPYTMRQNSRQYPRGTEAPESYPIPLLKAILLPREHLFAQSQTLATTHFSLEFLV